MASIPHFYPSYQFSPEEFSEITSAMAQENCSSSGATTFGSTISSTAGAMLAHEDHSHIPMLVDNGSGHDIFPGDWDTTSHVPMSSSFPERLGISDMVLMDYKLGARIQNFGGGLQLSDVGEFGEDCCGFVPNFTPVVCPSAGENWGVECNRMPINDQTNIKVGRYTVEERKDRILRYLKKRNQRNFSKTIKYACRKTLADRRVRVRGRFARNNELFEEETEGDQGKKDIGDSSPEHQEKESYSDIADAVQLMKNDDDEWLQEAVASLMYLPYIGSS